MVLTVTVCLSRGDSNYCRLSVAADRQHKQFNNQLINLTIETTATIGQLNFPTIHLQQPIKQQQLAN